jgi:tRNA modification GTPase
VSARTGDGLTELRRRVFVALTAREDLRDPPAITNARHLALVDTALDAMSRAEAALADGATEELILTDVTAARRALEEITGRRTTDDLLTHIFARFCLGK